MCRQRPEAADAEQLQAQQQALLTLGCRTMALPIGRGALTLGNVSSWLSDAQCLRQNYPSVVLPLVTSSAALLTCSATAVKTSALRKKPIAGFPGSSYIAERVPAKRSTS